MAQVLYLARLGLKVHIEPARGAPWTFGCHFQECVEACVRLAETQSRGWTAVGFWLRGERTPSVSYIVNADGTWRPL